MLAWKHAEGRERKEENKRQWTFMCRISPSLGISIENITVTTCWDENGIKGIVSFFPNKPFIYLSTHSLYSSNNFLADYVTGTLLDSSRDK